jgi:protein-S-isoprenylcysteine O-methyltransferase Ste14
MNIGTVQKIRKLTLLVAIILGVAIVSVTASRFPNGGRIHETIEWAGVVLIVACIVGRTWSSLYISGRKNTELVTIGPYSISRNPLYFFSVLGAAGMGAQIGSVVVAAVCGVIAWIIFHIVILQEERLLQRSYGKRYRDYMAKVPRFLPRPWRWRDTQTLTIRTPGVIMTFLDALLFLLAVPLAELFESLQASGAIPVLMVLP